MKALRYWILLILCGLSFHTVRADGYYWKDIEPRFDSLMRQMEAWSRKRSDTIRPEQVIERMRQLSEQHNNPQMRSRIHYWESCFRKNAPTDTLLGLIDRARQRCDSSAFPYDLARINMQKAVLLSHKANYPEAFRHYIQAIDELKETEDSRLQAYCYYNIGSIFFLLGEYGDAASYTAQADSIFECQNYPKEQIQCRLLMANTYIRAGQKQQAQTLLQPFINQTHPEYPLALRISLLTSYLSCLDNQDSIKYYSEAAFQLASQSKDPYFILITTLNKGHYLLNNGFTDSAHYYAMLAKNDQKIRAALPEMEEAIYKLLTAVYEKEEKWDSAFHYQTLYHTQQDSLRGKDVLADINRLKIKRQMEERRIQDILAQQKQKQTNQYFLIIGITLLVLLALSGYIIWILRRRMQAQQERQRQKDRQYIEQLSKEKELVESKNRELSSSTMLLMKKNTILKDMLKDMEDMSNQPNNNTRELQQRIQLELKQDSSWESFKLHFDKVHPMFFTILKEKFPKLTENELRLCAYIRIGLNNKQIAQMLLVQSKAILQARYRLKKKMDLPEETTLNSYLENIHI